MKIVSLLLLFVLSFVAHAAAVPASAVQGEMEFAEFQDPFEVPADRAPSVPDPLESVNRGAFWANDKLYTYLLQPFCEKVPENIRAAISQGIEWFMTPLRVGQVELEFTFRDAGSELGRFALRGLLTLMERVHPAATASVADGREDFDQVFAKMGFDSGFYLVLPVLGPSTLRDGLGRIASIYIDPPIFLRSGGHSAPAEGSLEDDLKTYAAIRASALDPYLFIRDAFQQQMARGSGAPSHASAEALLRGDSREMSLAHL